MEGKRTVKTSEMLRRHYALTVEYSFVKSIWFPPPHGNELTKSKYIKHRLQVLLYFFLGLCVFLAVSEDDFVPV